MTGDHLLCNLSMYQPSGSVEGCFLASSDYQEAVLLTSLMFDLVVKIYDYCGTGVEHVHTCTLSLGYINSNRLIDKIYSSNHKTKFSVLDTKGKEQAVLNKHRTRHLKMSFGSCLTHLFHCSHCTEQYVKFNFGYVYNWLGIKC